MTKISVKQISVIGNRPSGMPETALVFNAPRPLYGTITSMGRATSRGDFVTGIFWAAVCEDDPFRSDAISLNVRDEAVLVEFITEEQARERMLEYYRRKYPERVDKMLARYDGNEDGLRKMLMQTFWSHNAATVEIDI